MNDSVVTGLSHLETVHLVGEAEEGQRDRSVGSSVESQLVDMTLIIHEMLRKTRQGKATQQKDKATQHNSPNAAKRKLAASGGTHMNVTVEPL